MTEFSKPIPLPDDIARRMELAELLPAIRRIALPTMRKVIDRFRANTSAPGWIDMKFDPADGAERDASQERYRRDRVYGWIQGRGLESLAGHARWLSSMTGYGTLAARELIDVAESLYATLMGACFPLSGMRAHFVMDPSGEALSRRFDAGETTLTHLFVLRGLLAFAAYRGYSADLPRITEALRVAVDASIRGDCVNDQIGFGEAGGGLAFPAERKGYEGQMISLGACEMLFASTKAPEDLSRGMEIIRRVLGSYPFESRVSGLLIIDALDREGLPLRQNGHLTTNPGHALEFAGLALQYLRRAASIASSLDLPAFRGALADRETLTASLHSLSLRYTGFARAPHGGIVLSLDAETGELLNGNCPWWSSFEAARCFAELYLAVTDEAGQRECLDQAKSYLRCVEKTYLGPSRIGIPLQTVSFAGEVIPVIPATPDIDPGYHTGIPLIDVYEILGERSALLCGSAEAVIPVRLGRRLQGHIARTEPADREMDPLRARTCWLASAREQALFISADVLEFSAAWAGALCDTIESMFGMPKDNIFLLATHTHTAPGAIDLGLLKSDEAFLRSLESTILASVAAARDDLSPSAAALYESTIEGIGVNRRYRDAATGKILMRPNPRGEIDEDLTGLFLFDARGRPKTLLFNIATHPTTLGVSIHEISADYPGRAAARLRERFGPSLVAIPVQGACGDIRPAVLDKTGEEFAEGGEGDIDRIGSAIADLLHRGYETMAKGPVRWIDGSVLRVSTRIMDIPFARLPTSEGLRSLSSRLESEIEGAKAAPEEAGSFAATHENALLAAETARAWADGLLASSFDVEGVYSGPKSLPARFSLCRLGDSLLFFSLPGEAFCGIGKALKRRAKPATMFVCGYCGGTIGYIPTAKAFEEGGYEVEEAFRFYGLPAPLAPDAESIIYETFDSMRKESAPCQH